MPSDDMLPNNVRERYIMIPGGMRYGEERRISGRNAGKYE